MDNKRTSADLRAANKQLQASLDKCHALVAEYRSKLAANGNTFSSEEAGSFRKDASSRK